MNKALRATIIKDKTLGLQTAAVCWVPSPPPTESVSTLTTYLQEERTFSHRMNTLWHSPIRVNLWIEKFEDLLYIWPNFGEGRGLESQPNPIVALEGV